MISVKQMYRNAAAVHLFIGFKGMLKVKRAISLLMLCAVLVCCCGCDPYVGKKPYNYGSSIWICEEPKITYVIEMKYDESQEMEVPETYAVAMKHDKEVFFHLGFLSDTVKAREYKNIDSKEFTGNTLFTGTCKYSKTKFTIKIDTETDNLFGGEYDELVFVRQEDEQAD